MNKWNEIKVKNSDSKMFRFMYLLIIFIINKIFIIIINILIIFIY